MDTPSTLRVDPARILRFLLMAGTTVVIFGSLAHLVKYQLIQDETHRITKLLNRLDITHEPSLLQWYASSTMLISSVLLASIGTLSRRAGERYARHWLVLAGIFFLFSIDEAIMVHEMAVRPFQELFDTHGVLYIAWIIPGAVFVTVVGFAYLPFLRDLDRRSRLLFFGSGATYIAGALGMELPGGVLYERYEFTTWHYIASYCLAELLESVGIAWFIYALLDYIGRHTAALGIDVRTG